MGKTYLDKFNGMSKDKKIALIVGKSSRSKSNYL